MDLADRISAFQRLGNHLAEIDVNHLQTLIENVSNQNSWFTRDNVICALEGIKRYLNGKHLTEWVARYNLTVVNPKIVAVIMAGNIPLVGFHDFLSVLISGHSILIKLSSKDSVLITYLANQLMALEPRFKGKIVFAEQLKNFDAVIATGSDNSARYFNYYFGKYPNIIRKNRTSCAIVSGNESDEELCELGADVFTYFGLGCRNVSKIFVPHSYDITQLFDRWKDYQKIIHHHKYHNNYDYQKSILLVNRDNFLDSGFVMLQESEKLVSPISVVYYERYEDAGSLALKLVSVRDKLQCIVGKAMPASVPFGQAQSPSLWDYADQIDTLKFLEELH